MNIISHGQIYLGNEIFSGMLLRNSLYTSSVESIGCNLPLLKPFGLEVAVLDGTKSSSNALGFQ